MKRGLKTEVGFTWEASDWTEDVRGANSLDELKQNISRWAPFVDDAIIAANNTSWDEWLSERNIAYDEKGNPSDKWLDKHGAIVLPENLIIGSQVADKFQAPLGAALNRLLEVNPSVLKHANTGRSTG